MKSGFTLIELLVSISIFIIITSVAIWNNNAFNSSVLLTDLGYEIALSVRQAQVYGTTVKAPSLCVNGSCSSYFTSGYGVDFNITQPSQYILFEDGKVGSIPDHIYEQGELLENYTIGRGYSIKKLCVSAGNGTYKSTNKIDISFIRPEPEAWVYDGIDSPSQIEVDIYVQDPQKTTDRDIVIEPTGQISVVNDDTVLNECH